MQTRSLIALLFPVLLSFLSTATALAQPIVGGATTKPGEFPDVVAVLSDEGACSGTLIAPDLVLTAGHCIGIAPTRVVVNTLDYGRPGGEEIAVLRAHAYPDWETTYDVGLVVLARPATAAKPRAIARACSGKTIAQHQLRIVGFGLIDPAGRGDNTRLHAAMIGVDDPRCTEAPGCNVDVAPDGEFSAGGHGTDSCFGDSGGPAFVRTPSGLAVLGVVSRGMDLPGRPCGNGGIYVRADKVVTWIERTAQRRVTRTPCDRPSDDDELAETTSAGCHAAGEAGGGVAAVLLALVGIGGIGRIVRGRNEERRPTAAASTTPSREH